MMQATNALFLFPNRAREQQIPKCNEIVEKLDPIIQATKLLQTKKTEEHIPTIVETTYRLRCVERDNTNALPLILGRRLWLTILNGQSRRRLCDCDKALAASYSLSGRILTLVAVFGLSLLYFSPHYF